jgi:hypothetical protein
LIGMLGKEYFNDVPLWIEFHRQCLQTAPTS